MSIFASLTVSDPIPIPFDPPHSVIVRKLTGLEHDAAQEAHRGNFASGSPRLWAATFRRALEKGASDPVVLQALADPLTGYDRFTVVRAGLVSWTYPQAIKPVAATAATAGEGSAPAATAAVEAADAIADLDDEAVDFIAREVLRRTKPRLFQTADEAEIARKNAPRPSSMD